MKLCMTLTSLSKRPIVKFCRLRKEKQTVRNEPIKDFSHTKAIALHLGNISTTIVLECWIFNMCFVVVVFFHNANLTIDYTYIMIEKLNAIWKIHIHATQKQT